ncbi:MAG: hypothetical protein IKG22_01760 [Atopobiaceae bacterium]|nr:hypothetical protein [Atopobiaceae bacterium]
MNVTESIRRMCVQSGRGPVEVSGAIGRSRAFLSSALTRGTMPRVDTLAKVAQACGYQLVLESDTDRIEIDVE